jgi:hypothetical protein
MNAMVRIVLIIITAAEGLYPSRLDKKSHPSCETTKQGASRVRKARAKNTDHSGAISEEKGPLAQTVRATQVVIIVARGWESAGKTTQRIRTQT